MQPRYIFRFDSWGTFVTHAEHEKSVFPDFQRASRGAKGPSEYKAFTGAENFQEVVRLSKEGWPKGTKEVETYSAAMFTHISSRIERVDVNHDIEGHAIDVARFVDGEPECWLKFQDVIQEAESGRRLIRLVFNNCVSSGIEKSTIIRRGASIAALVELLEYAGHRVEVTLCSEFSSYAWRDNREPALSVKVKIKEFDQNINKDVLAFSLAHPASFRALTFAVSETCPNNDLLRELGIPFGGYGQPGESPKDERGDIYIGSAHYDDDQWRDEESAERWIIKELEKQGINLKKEAAK